MCTKNYRRVLHYILWFVRARKAFTRRPTTTTVVIISLLFVTLALRNVLMDNKVSISIAAKKRDRLAIRIDQISLSAQLGRQASAKDSLKLCKHLKLA